MQLIDRAEFTERVLRSQRVMYLAALAITKNEQDALDAVQEAILIAWRKLPSLRDSAKFGSWIARIAIRRAQTMTRCRKPSAELPDELPATTVGFETRMDVRKAVDSLDERTRLCTMLYYLEDLPISRVAQIAGISEGTVKSRLHRARTKLRLALEGYDE